MQTVTIVPFVNLDSLWVESKQALLIVLSLRISHAKTRIRFMAMSFNSLASEPPSIP
jgi:hypothetical protein